MALIKCHECGRSISTKAAACPNCGAPPGKHPKSGSRGCGCSTIVISTLIFLFLIVLLSLVTGDGGRKLPGPPGPEQVRTSHGATEDRQARNSALDDAGAKEREKETSDQHEEFAAWRGITPERVALARKTFVEMAEEAGAATIVDTVSSRNDDLKCLRITMKSNYHEVPYRDRLILTKRMHDSWTIRLAVRTGVAHGVTVRVFDEVGNEIGGTDENGKAWVVDR